MLNEAERCTYCSEVCCSETLCLTCAPLADHDAPTQSPEGQGFLHGAEASQLGATTQDVDALLVDAALRTDRRPIVNTDCDVTFDNDPQQWSDDHV